MTSIMDPTLRGTGRISGAFFNPAGDIAAVVSEFALLVNPPARAAYGGTGLRYRLGLYRRGEPVPFAIFDELCLPINDVGFHPTLPRIVIGAGRYDGGYLFEGELAVWDWQTGQSRRPLPIFPKWCAAATTPTASGSKPGCGHGTKNGTGWTTATGR